MKTYLNGGHYFVHIGEFDEFPRLKESPLEASLQNGDDGSDFKKKVTLTYDPEAKEDSIRFVPPRAYFDKIKAIHIVINQEQYDNLEQNRMSIFRFGGSFSVDVKTLRAPYRRSQTGRHDGRSPIKKQSYPMFFVPDI